jgi:DNA-binding transcriptional LysR family regulator
MEVDLRHLRHGPAVAEHGGFSRAAQALHLKQPALLRSIQTQDSALGATAFERGRAGVKLTEVGRMVLAHAKATSLASRDLLHEVAQVQSLEQGELRIGAGPYGGAALVGPVDGRLHRLHPRLRIGMVVAPCQEFPARLQSRELDLMVGELSPVEPHDEFETQPLTLALPVVVSLRWHPLLNHPAPTA